MNDYPAERERSVGEAEEMEAAAELLEATNEQELDHFLNRFLQRRYDRRGRRYGGPTSRALGGWIKGAMRRILPGLGRYNRGYGGQGYPYPAYSPYSSYSYPQGVPDNPGDRDDSDYSNDPGYPDPRWRYGQLAPGAGQMLGFEMEGLSDEDREFSAARQLVRLAGAAADAAAGTPEASNPAAVAERAMARAAQTYAPGLLRPAAPGHSACGCGSAGQCQCHSPI